jgi:hypothetical protein
MSATARILISLGLFLVVAGFAWEFRDKLPFLKWIGHLPGDISYSSGNTRVFIPITTSILLSLFVSVVLRLISYLSKP